MEDREYLRFGDVIVDDDTPERMDSYKVGVDIEPCSHREL